MKNSLVKTLAILLLTALLGLNARAQQDEDSDNDQGIGKRRPDWSLPANIREDNEQQELLKQKFQPRGPVKVTPWLNANGERLVGVVENRTLTRPQLELRVNLFLQHQPPLQDPVKAEDRRIICESRILADWAQVTLLAVHGERSGFNATAQEIDQSLKQLASQSVEDSAKAQEQMQMIGIPENELRQELHDGIVVEKFLRSAVSKVSDGDLRKVFQAHPTAFLEPMRVKAWQLFQPMRNGITRKEQAELLRGFEKWGKKLRKCRKQEDYLELQKELKSQQDIALSYLDRVANNEPLPPAVIKEMFSLEPGETSKIIPSPIGLHVVKVLERIEGFHGRFEEAKPRIQNYIIEKLKDAMYEKLTPKYQIYTSAAGLNKYQELVRPTSSATNATDLSAGTGANGSSSTDAVNASPATNTEGVRASHLSVAPPPPWANDAKPPRRLLGNPPPVEQILAEQASHEKTDPADNPLSSVAKPQRGHLGNPPSVAQVLGEQASPEGTDHSDSLASPAAQQKRETAGNSALDRLRQNVEDGSTPKNSSTLSPLVRRRKATQPKKPLFRNPPSVEEVLSKQAREESLH